MQNDYRIYHLRQKSHWGPIFWDFLYLMSFGLPVSLTSQQEKEVGHLLETFYLFLPCQECRYHYKQEVSSLSMKFKSKDEVFSMILFLHNQVRKRQKKNTFTKENIIAYHFNKVTNTHTFPSIVIFISVVFLYALKQRKKLF